MTMTGTNHQKYNERKNYTTIAIIILGAVVVIMAIIQFLKNWCVRSLYSIYPDNQVIFWLANNELIKDDVLLALIMLLAGIYIGRWMERDK